MTKLSPKELERMEQWQTIVGLLGYGLDDILCDDDEDGVYQTIVDYRRWQQRLENPDNAMVAALRTIEMGITDDDIYNLERHYETINYEEDEARRQQLVDTNPALVKLKTVHEFAFVTSKQYPKHKHFEFKMPSGVKVAGRAYQKSWDNYVIWMQWRNEDNKIEKQQWKVSIWGTKIPKTFPESWRTGFRVDIEHLCYATAHFCTNKRMPAGLVWPGKKTK